MKKIVGIIFVLLIIIVGVVGYFILNNKNGFHNNLLEETDNTNSQNNILINEEENEFDKEGEQMVIRVSDGIHTVIFELNDSNAAKSLYEQLPLTLKVEDLQLHLMKTIY